MVVGGFTIKAVKEVPLMNVCMIFPPVFDPSMPYLAPFQLRAYIEKHLPGCKLDVLDLNILFFNSIINNPYQSFTRDLDLVDSYMAILASENEIHQALQEWSRNRGVAVARQGIDYSFNQDVSANVSRFIAEGGRFYESLEEIYKSNVDLSKYDVVGFSIAVYDQLIPALILAEITKRSRDSIVTVLGGNVVSRISSELLTANLVTNIDYLVKMEGELPLENLIRHLTNRNIEKPTNNLIHANTASIVDIVDSPAGVVVDMDSFPMVTFNANDLARYYSPVPVLPIQLSRGCSWGRCTYCGIYSGWCASYRARSISSMADEIAHHVSEYGVRNFRLVEESPSLDHILGLSAEIISRKLDVRVEAYLNVNKRLVDDSVVNILYKAGFRQLFLGLESVDQDVLRSVEKGINNPSYYAEILECLHRHGISTYCFFLIGLPEDQIANEVKLEEFVVDTESIDTMAVSSYIPITNSKMFSSGELFVKYGLDVVPKGDITTRCDYGLNGSLGEAVSARAERMVTRIFQRRLDLYISSNIPYEARFYMIVRFGNAYGKVLAKNSRFANIAVTLSDELRQRIKGLSGRFGDMDAKPDGD